MKKQNFVVPLLVAAIGFGWPHFAKVSATEKTAEPSAENKEASENIPQLLPAESVMPEKKKPKVKPPSKVEALLKSSAEKPSHYKRF